MNFRQIECFVAVFEEGSFSKGAERAGCTQSALSQQIHNLELRLDLRLLERTPHGATPTIAGRRYYDDCVAILRSVRAAENRMQDLRGSLTGTLRAGLIPSLTKGALASVLANFTDTNPNVDVRIVEAYSQPLTDMVINGELDFAIVPVMPSRDVPGLNRRVLARETELLLSGPALGMTNMQPIPLAQVSGQKLVLPSPANSRRPYLDNQLAFAGITPLRVMDMDGMTGTLEFVAGSDWATILPVTNCIDELPLGRLVLNPIIEPEITFEFILIEPSSRPLGMAAQVFVEGIEEKLVRIAERWSRLRAEHPRSA
jgi:LysR family nitrogen assimilation transcriptional regulator